MEKPFWIFLFPMIYWFLTHSVYKFNEDNEVIAELKDGKVSQNQKGVNAFAMGGISLILANLLNLIVDYLTLGTSISINIGILIFTLILFISSRYYLSKVNNHRMKKRFDIEHCPKVKIRIVPTSIKYILQAMITYIFILIAIFIFSYIFIIEGDAISLFFFTLFLSLFLITNIFVVSMENFRI